MSEPLLSSYAALLPTFVGGEPSLSAALVPHSYCPHVCGGSVDGHDAGQAMTQPSAQLWIASQVAERCVCAWLLL